MNNSLIEMDSTVEEPVQDKLQEEEARLIRIINAVKEVKSVKGWSTLKELIFDSQAVQLRKDLLSEAKKDDPDPKRLNRISGKLYWADRFANLDILEADYSKPLAAIKQKLHG